MRHKSIKAIIFLSSMILIQGCGGGGEEKSSITSPSQLASFRGAPAGNKAVYMTQNSSLGNSGSLAIDVKVGSVSDAYGAGFDVDFDSSKLSYDGYVAGGFLENGIDTVNYNVTTQPGNSGKLIVGISRLGSVGGVSGSGTIITLKFKVVTSGNSPVTFSNYVLRDPNNQTIAGTTWNGGTATIF